MDPIAGRGAYINGTNTGLCVSCTAASGANIIDGNLTNFATLTTGIGVLGGGSGVSVKDSLQYYPAGNVAGFVVKYNGGLLSAAVLNQIEIRTYRNGVLQETAVFNSGSGLLSANVLNNDGGKQILKFTTTKNFDEVQLYAPSALTALSSIDVYYAFEGPANCATDCVNALTGSEVGTPATGSISLAVQLPPLPPIPIPCVAIGTVISNEARVTDSDSANFATINIIAGLSCAFYIDVPMASTISNNPFVGFAVSNAGGLLNTTVLGDVQVQTYMGTTLQNTFSGASLISAGVLNSSTTLTQIGGKATLPFNKVRIRAGSLASLAYVLRVYYAFTKTDTDNDGVYDCMDKCAGDDLLDTDGDGIPNLCDDNMADLAITKTVDADSVAAGTDVTFTITVTRQADATGFEAPTGVKIKDLLPTGLTYVSHVEPTGTFYNQTTGIWNVGSALSGPTTSLALTITASADSTGVLSNIAQVQSMNEGDPDSTPGNGTTGTGGSEDDIASACVSVPIFLCPGSSLVVAAPSGATGYQWYRNGAIIAGATDSTYTVTQSGSYTFTSSVVGACLSGNCCPVVVIYRVLVADAGTDPAPVCAGTTVALTGSGAGAGGSYLWSTGATTASISVAPTITTTYILTVTSVDGCVDKDTVVVTVNPKPLIGSVIAVCNNAGTTDNAADDTFTFALNPGGGSNTTYTVSGITPTGPFNYGAPQNFGPFLASAGNKVITITDANTCTTTVTVVAPVGGCSNCSPTPVCVPVTVRKLQ
ncbi:DUF11 domain-containing protein [Runella sp.]|uniref:DUF11 domain-containing protein n=1 Tax=Runella sp. TaxID=1960881 RepID=UPI003D0DD182